jgi:hypothetical protein
MTKAGAEVTLQNSEIGKVGKDGDNAGLNSPSPAGPAK